MKNTSGFTHWAIVILISIMAIGLVGAAWYYEENKGKIVNTNTTVSNNTETNTNVMADINSNSDISEWETYENEELGFSFQYPTEFGDLIFNKSNGTTGQKISGTFSKSDALIFGGVSLDYSLVLRIRLVIFKKTMNTICLYQ